MSNQSGQCSPGNVRKTLRPFCLKLCFLISCVHKKILKSPVVLARSKLKLFHKHIVSMIVVDKVLMDFRHKGRSEQAERARGEQASSNDNDNDDCNLAVSFFVIKWVWRWC